MNIAFSGIHGGGCVLETGSLLHIAWRTYHQNTLLLHTCTFIDCKMTNVQGHSQSSFLALPAFNIADASDALKLWFGFLSCSNERFSFLTTSLGKNISCQRFALVLLRVNGAKMWGALIYSYVEAYRRMSLRLKCKLSCVSSVCRLPLYD